MKKIIMVYGAIIFASFFLTSCGCESKKEYSIKPNSITIKGDLSDFFEVVDGTYNIEKDYSQYGCVINFKIQVKRKDKQFDKISDITIYSELLDENQSPVGVKLESYYLLGEMLALQPNETAWIKLYSDNTIDEEVAEKVKSFSLSSTVKKSEENKAISTPNLISDKQKLNDAYKEMHEAGQKAGMTDQEIDDFAKKVIEANRNK